MAQCPMPAEGSTAVYAQPEFFRSLKVVVLSSRQLFGWWAANGWEALYSVVLGQSAVPPPAMSPASPTPAQEGWFGRPRRR